MKHFLVLLLIVIIVAYSCKKNNDAPAKKAPQFEDFIGKYLICDSMVINAFGTKDVWRYGKDKGWDMMLRTNGTIVAAGERSSQSTLYYEFKRPDTLFAWYPDNPRTPDAYMIVRILSEKKINTIEFAGGKSKENFYTVNE